MRYALFPLLLALSCSPASPGGEDPAPTTVDSPSAPVVNTPVINGVERILLPDGRVRMEGDKKNGLREGVWTSYGPAGEVQSRSEYRDGRLNGLSTVFHPNGAVYYTGMNQDGHPVGEWRFNDLDGTLLKTVTYDSTGVIVSQVAN